MRLVVCLLILTKCYFIMAASRKNKPTGRIIGGHDATPHNYPYMISLQLKFLWVRAHYCGGSLLNEDWVLTAAHCLSDSWILYLFPVDAVAGAHDVDDDGPQVQVIRIDQRIPHPDYKGDIGPFDIGLMKTRYPFTLTRNIQPINLPSSSEIPDQLTLVGWGALKTTFFFPRLPGKLQEIKLKYIPYEECHDAVNTILEGNEENPLVENANICTGPLTGGLAACAGDSGGPLIQFNPKVKDINDSLYDIDDMEETDYEDLVIKADTSKDIDEYIPTVVGVVSWGAEPCGQKGAPTVYSNVIEYMDFISQTTRIQ